ncbi:hypothetical protein N9D90_00795 [Alphaproteobacteria bacterium]|nr:hypothetical protein [Alphaproteobacteria bacterium]
MIKREDLKKAYAKWQKEQNFTMFATLKFVDGYELNDNILEKRMRYFCNKLDRQIQTHKEIKEGKRLKRFVYVEKGKSRQNKHAHIFTKGKTLNETKEIFNKAFEIWQTVEMASDFKFVVIDDNKGIKGYCTKELETIDTDLLLLSCTHL